MFNVEKFLSISRQSSVSQRGKAAKFFFLFLQLQSQRIPNNSLVQWTETIAVASSTLTFVILLLVIDNLFFVLYDFTFTKYLLSSLKVYLQRSCAWLRSLIDLS